MWAATPGGWTYSIRILIKRSAHHGAVFAGVHRIGRDPCGFSRVTTRHAKVTIVKFVMVVYFWGWSDLR